jgi:hypothetical protein
LHDILEEPDRAAKNPGLRSTSDTGLVGVILKSKQSLTKTHMTLQTTQPNGPAWAALIAGAFGGFLFGVLTDISEVSKTASDHLQWYRPAGALSGVAIAAVAIWLIVWAILHVLWKNKRMQNQQLLLLISCALILGGIIATFPPFYELLGG